MESISSERYFSFRHTAVSSGSCAAIVADSAALAYYTH
jgi:hypothetical protein